MAGSRRRFALCVAERVDLLCIGQRRMFNMKRWVVFGLFLAAFMSGVIGPESMTCAQDPPAPAAAPAVDPVTALTANSSALRIGLDTAWVLIAGMLVFWMNAGFALVESGLCQQKNCVNILAKNFIVFAASALSFYVVGWDLMFGTNSPYFGAIGQFFASGEDNSPALGAAYAAMNPFSTDVYKGSYEAINWTPVPLWAKFFFQLV